MESKESNSGDSSRFFLSGPGVAMILSLIAFLFAHSPFKLARPASEDAKQDTEGKTLKAESRSWDDPFAEASSITARLDKPNLVSRSQNSIQELADDLAGSSSNKVMLAMVLVNGSPYANALETRLRARLTIQSAMRASGFVRWDADVIRFLCLPEWNGPQSWVDWIGKPLQITNYAASQTVLVSYEWFTIDKSIPANTNYDKALVFWLKEEDFNPSPFAKIASLLGGLFDREGCNPPASTTNITLAIVGPRSSSGLRAMTQDASLAETGTNDSSIAVKLVRSAKIISTSASAPDYFFLEKSMCGECQTNFFRPRDRVSWLLSKNLANCEFNSFGCTDDQLCFLLVAELAMRHVNLTNDPIVLLSEYDTFYGRALPLTFKAALLAAKHCGYLPSSDINRLYSAVVSNGVEYCNLVKCFETNITTLLGDPSAGPKNVLHYSFLAGVDGYKTKIANSKSSEKEASSENSEADTLERPEGEQQLDYIRRLADNLGKSEATYVVNTAPSPPVAAVGLLGSDFYDKLLLLQSLRGPLDGAVFFTTDLDSRLHLHSQHQWTRNLITASSYDIQASEEGNGLKLSPFRDAYQTALFLGCRFLLNPEKSFPPNDISAYEIGRERDYRLEVPKPVLSNASAFNWLAPSATSSIASIWDRIKIAQIPDFLIKAPALLAGFVGFLFVILVSLFLSAGKKNTVHKTFWRKLLLSALILVGIIAWITIAGCVIYFTFTAGFEPLEVGDGVSAFASTILLAFALAIGGFALLVTDRFDTRLRDATGQNFALFVPGILIVILACTLISVYAPMPLRGSQIAFRCLFWGAWTVCGCLCICTACFFRHFLRNATTKIADARALIPTGANFLLNFTFQITRCRELGEETEHLSRLLSFPMIALLLILLAGSKWLDDWSWLPWMKAFFGAEVLLVVLGPVVLQRAAARIRSVLRSRFIEYESTALGTASFPPGLSSAEDIDTVRSLLDDLDEGCFAPLGKQPVFGALAWLIGGSGIVSILQPLLTGHS